MIKTPLSTMIGGAFWTPGATILGSTSATLDTIIKSLFANSEQGFAYDPNDLTTLYQDAAGTIPVTASGQPVGLMKDKSGRNNHAYQTVSASRPILQRNATTGAYYLAFDGVDDFLQTSSIDFTTTDKVSLFAGVRRLNDEVAAIAELSAGMPANTGTFGIYSNWTVTTDNALVFSSRGNHRISPMVNGVQRNVSYVLVGKSNLRGNFTQVKVGNSTQTLNTDLGGGNYGNYPLYIGRRAGTSLPFNGHLYNLIGIGRLTTDSETIALEKLIAKNTGVTLS